MLMHGVILLAIILFDNHHKINEKCLASYCDSYFRWQICGLQGLSLQKLFRVSRTVSLYVCASIQLFRTLPFIQAQRSMGWTYFK